jgi:hypothetical protein
VDLSKLSDEELMRAAGGAPAPTTPQIDYSTLPDDVLMKAAGINAAAPEPQQQPGFMQRLKDDFARRKSQAEGLARQSVRGEISTPEALVRGGLKLAMTAPDTFVNVVSTVVPDSIEKPIVESIGSGISYLANTRPGRMAVGAVNDFNQKYPITAGRIGSVGDAVNLAAPFAKVGGTSVVGASTKAAGEVADAAAGVAGNVIESGADKLATMMAKRSGELIPVNNSEIKKIYQRLVADYGEDEARRVINSYASSKGKSLIEAGGTRTTNLAEGAAQYPSGGAKATEFFNEATGRAPDKLKTSAAKTISPSVNYYDTVDKILEEGRAKAAPLYQEAFKANQQVNSKVISRILETPEGKSALSDAARNMQNEMALLSKPDPELTALAREAGMAATGEGVGKGFKLKTLDYVKKAMDDTIRKAIRAGDEGEVKRITALKNGIVSQMDRADTTGLYAKARKEAGDYLSANAAIEQGTRFLKDDSQLIARNFELMGTAEKRAYKVGVLKTIRDNIENQVDGSNVARVFNRPATRDKLKAILNEKEYEKLLADAEATDKIFKLRNQITGNSRTASRQIAAEEFDTAGADVINDLINKGVKRTAGERTVKWISRRFDGLSDKSAGEVARILYETDPQEKYKIVKDLANLAAQPNMRGTEAGNKLKAFYAISDGLKKKNSFDSTKQNLQNAFDAKKGTQ